MEVVAKRFAEADGVADSGQIGRREWLLSDECAATWQFSRRRLGLEETVENGITRHNSDAAERVSPPFLTCRHLQPTYL